MPVSEKTYRRIALEDPNGHWELHGGVLRQKPGMSFEHNHITSRLFLRLGLQLDEREFTVRSNLGHVRHTAASYYIPDVFVVPTSLVEAERQRGPNRLEVYDAPLPLVIEVWSPSTGDYDVDTKILEYERRGDLEIWRVHPVEKTITVWRWQPDGSYAESRHVSGTVRPAALPGVSINLGSLFE